MTSPTGNSDAGIRFVTAALLACIALGSQAGTPSFVCSKAKSWLEKTVCASDRLSDLDMELAGVYARLLRVTTGETQRKLSGEQNRFWAARGDCRAKPDPLACLDSLYSARIATLRERPDYTELRPTQIELPPEQLASAGTGWSKALGKYRKAIRACLRRTPTPAKAVLVAWPDEEREGAVGMRLQGPNGENWMCVAAASGLEVFSLREANDYETLPAPGPVYYPDPSAPPAAACGKPIQILDENDAPSGWLGPGCAPTVATPQSAAPDPEASAQVR